MKGLKTKYKDLIYKITSDSDKKPEDKMSEVNDAKKSVQVNNNLIGIIVGEETELTSGMIVSLKNEIERTLTVLTNSPIADTFSFLPYTQKTLNIITSTFPEKNLYYVSDRDEFNDISALKKEKLNIKMIYPSLDKKEDFIKKIDYLVTINYELEPTMQAALKTNNIMVFPMNFRGVEAFAQKEKLVAPDPSGWVYNSASGMWVKNWGWDGSQSIQGW